jgi:hypothetical protein
VEEAVGAEHRDLVEDARSALAGLPPRRRNADDDVAQDGAGERGEVAFSHRERKDVGWTIFMSIDLVQLMNAFVVR